MRFPAPLAVAMTIALTSSCLAGAQDVSSELRQRAIQTCSGDALRLCPQSIMDEGAAVSCMAGKRPELTPSCRMVYDQVARVLRR